jgi:hypothetical protein
MDTPTLRFSIGWAADVAARTVTTYWCAHRRAHAAMCLHAEISRLSDAELARRGLTLADVNRLTFERVVGDQSQTQEPPRSLDAAKSSRTRPVLCGPLVPTS